MVLLTIGEFMADPDELGRAYLACMVASHLADHVACVEKAKPEEIRAKVSRRDVTTGTTYDFYAADALDIAGHQQRHEARQYGPQRGAPIRGMV